MTTTASSAPDPLARERVDGSLGRIQISNVPLPDHVRSPSATYLPSGKVFVLYRTDEHDAAEDWYHAAVVEDDGSGFTDVFSGRIPQKPTANGVRHMPFADNRRVLLGDYVLETSPDLDTATAATLVDVEYPWGLASDPLTSHHWSEIIVSQDEEHIAWTILRTDLSAVVALGRLQREPDRYTIQDPAIISSPTVLTPDPERDGYFTTRSLLGGEVKQFVRGGAAIASVGDGGAALTDSVIQDLRTETVEAITRTPGYDETTVLSPDERLGITMSARASATTDPIFLGLLPRPHGQLATLELSWVIYLYVVDGVRRFRPGNIGPVLVDLERSRSERDYAGVPLNSADSSWVYVSPMSWHPGGRKTMWMEMLRGTFGGNGPTLRIRTAELLDHTPDEPVGTVPTPSAPYGINGQAARDLLARPAPVVPSGRIAGAASGYLEFERTSDGRGSFAASVRYVDYSDDGRNVYSGFERSSGSLANGAVYEANIDLAGEPDGEMRLRATWSGVRDGTRLLFGTGEDGTPLSYGFARYGDATARVEDLVE
ncbi:hypothetical protein [Leifsonia sp. 21MFCrub1.1]|uniref:hypothetical protein n=1 Tax=Leifsonia sp. 21MFCrub1.1 TaxID=1798223 RepID=UPI0008928C81|nr:hypothetical protein [Leifsonia sp. 21MFCrub1.1]SEB08533.1 hypothetical protein SAMN04515680_3144 [Leifsonia sp. 21MFCrub1.1]